MPTRPSRRWRRSAPTSRTCPRSRCRSNGGCSGTAFIAVERAGSVVEPAIGTYDDEELKAAFAADDGCEHVIQPF